MTRRTDPFASGASRAGQERARRLGTPLVTGAAASAKAAAAAKPATPDQPAASHKPAAPHKPAASHKPVTSDRPAAPAKAAARPLRLVEPPAGATAAAPAADSAGATSATPAATPATPAATAATPPRRPARSEFARGRTPRTPAPVPVVDTGRSSSTGAGAAGGESAEAVAATARAGARRAESASTGAAKADPFRRDAADPHFGDHDDLFSGSVDDFVHNLVEVMRLALATTGLSQEAVEARIAHALAYLRRRVDGSFVLDDFGFDQDFTDNVFLPLLRPLYTKWFRVEVRGLANLPATGGALVVANHSGTIAFDSLMTQVAVRDEAGRNLRMLGADMIFAMPVLGMLARRTGTTRAGHIDAERLLSRGELVGVWPEGFKGIGKPFSERYKLQRFGRGGFVSAAVRAGVPIVPCSIVGAEEIYPMLGNAKALARVLGLPYLPITPTFPWLGPLGLVPLPSKWIIEFGTPLRTDDLPRESAEDPSLVFDLTDRVRETIQQTLYALLLQRRSVFS